MKHVIALSSITLVMVSINEIRNMNIFHSHTAVTLARQLFNIYSLFQILKKLLLLVTALGFSHF